MGSWLDMVKTQFSIKLGDGNVLTPKSFNANKSDEFNLAEFNFRNLDGTLVDRRRKMGTVYNLELYFDGANHIDQAKRFQKSSNNRGAWTITHPFYGKLVVQPIAPVNYDNANNLLNVTKITTTVKETIGAKDISNTEAAPDIIAANAANTNTFYADYYVSAVPSPGIKDTNQMQDDISGFQKALQKVSDTEGNILNAANKAKNTVNNIFSKSDTIANNLSAAVSTIQDLINAPVTIEESIFNKVSYLDDELNSLYNQAAALSLPVLPNFKDQWASLVNLWNMESGTCISGMCVAATEDIQPTDYVYSSDALAVISLLTTAYNTYIANIDLLQSFNGAEPGNFVADVAGVAALTDLVNYTIVTLFNIQANAKQPRTFTLTKDNNVINIAYQLYGLVADDGTIDKIIADNNIYGEELIQVLKGRQIIYYV